MTYIDDKESIHPFKENTQFPGDYDQKANNIAAHQISQD